MSNEEQSRVDKLAMQKYLVQMDCITLNNEKIEYDYNEEIREAFKVGYSSRKGEEKLTGTTPIGANSIENTTEK
jgi:hypothetical protein